MNKGRSEKAIMNEHRRNMWVEKNDSMAVQNEMCTSQYAVLKQIDIGGWLDQWTASYYRHINRPFHYVGGGDGDWDFGYRVYPQEVMDLLVSYRKYGAH